MDDQLVEEGERNQGLLQVTQEAFDAIYLTKVVLAMRWGLVTADRKS